MRSIAKAAAAIGKEHRVKTDELISIMSRACTGPVQTERQQR